MPWWIWLLLVLFMIAMIVIGGIYAVRRAIAALGVVSDTGAQVGERLARMGEPYESGTGEEPPVFTQPLKTAAERYEQAHIGVILRKEAKRGRHVEAWRRWRNGVLG
ncbi:hypothetical protein JS528_01160 [Bifidobacterium sp. MA2]|uniref:Prolyl aminopeptidase n=1 Tax=Bifidobacterium santillanense TaxID=2809028 RepID=A0ABS5UM73_9BIFI|nr:hypothetical protein [Bifidobacterium santillanense]MBT1171989.1 hypothetical protein [Bifidobacterium santillanense]